MAGCCAVSVGRLPTRGRLGSQHGPCRNQLDSEFIRWRGPLADGAMTLEFGADGTVAGFDGCNRFNTTYTQNGVELTVAQPAASTLMACDELVTAQATAFQEALATAATYRIQGNTQELRTADDALAVMMQQT